MNGYAWNESALKEKTSYQEFELKVILRLSILWLGYSFAFNLISYTAGIIFTGLYLFLFSIQSLEKQYYYIIFTLPFAAIFKLTSNLPSSLIFLYVIYMTNTYFYKKKTLKLMDLILFFAICALQIISAIIYHAGLVSIVSFLFNVLFVKTCIVNFMDIEPDNKLKYFKNSILMFSCSMALSILVTDLWPGIPSITNYEVSDILNQINRFAGLNGDPNYYSQLVLIAIAFMMFLILNEKEKKNLIIDAGIAAYLIFNGFRSLSKSYALTFLFVIATFFIYYFIKIYKNKTSIRVYFWMIVIFSVCLLALYSAIMNIVIPLIEARNQYNSLLTGRGEIWTSYIAMFAKNPEMIFIGTGFANGANILNLHFGKLMAAHNIYIELLGELGIICMMTIIVFLREILMKPAILFKGSASLYLMVILITGFALSFSATDVLYILLPLSMLTLSSNQELKLRTASPTRYY
ncbi:MAG: O-antigen ligase family protein [Eubacteriaceae bacterium]|nr:O-antigen ligase family protein [Eubacteriaceae bacterium]